MLENGKSTTHNHIFMVRILNVITHATNSAGRTSSEHRAKLGWLVGEYGNVEHVNINIIRYACACKYLDNEHFFKSIM